MNAARKAQLDANNAANSKFAIDASYNVCDKKGNILKVGTSTSYAANEAEAAEWVAHFEWLNENRTAKGKYFNITVKAI